MEVKSAVQTAKNYVREIFEDEEISNLGLEEIQRKGGSWEITIGFSRAWDRNIVLFLEEMYLEPIKSYLLMI